MSSASDARHYENPEMWRAERYLGDESETRRFHAAADLVAPECRSLLDVGTGNGALLHVLEERRPDLRMEGLERARAAVDQRVCRSGIRIGSSDELPFEDRSHDVVTALEVIEHLPFGVYEKSLAEMERVAARQIIVSVPYREDRLWVRCPYCECRFNPHYHLRRFDDAAMGGLFKTFRCERVVKVHTDEVVVGRWLRAGYRWVRQKAGFYPGLAMCPQCGYRPTEAEGRAASTRGSEPPAKGRAARVMQVGRIAQGLLPRRSRPKWVLGVYVPRSSRGA